jgi:NADPH:quinone reductase-like Zn-dependent oxidoreductase
MKAALRDHYGTTDVVRIEDIERPEPTGDQVLVRVAASSVNRGDLDALGPKPAFARAFMGLRAPRQHRLGFDVAGTVEAAGPDATIFRSGDRVFADLFSYGSGGFGEYVCASERAFATIPPDMSFEEAATLPHAAILAVQGLRRRDGSTFRPGAKVLIDGASGNVGPFAVQIAKARGAEVTGVASAEKLEFVRSLGADHVLDYRAVDYTAQPDRYDWILDTDSHHPIFRCRGALAPGGAYVSLGGSSSRIIQSMTVGPLISAGSGRWSGLMLWWKPFGIDDVRTITRLIAEEKVKPVIDRRYPLGEIVAALRWVDDGHARGKVIVMP